MKFFYTNPDQDKLYLKVNTLINISYWIASDAFHFASKQVKEINKYEYNNLQSQYDLANNLYKDAKDLSESLTGDHHKSAELLLNHSIKSFDEFQIDKIFMPEITSNELDKLDIQDAIFDEDLFYASYRKFLTPGDIESDFIKAELIFGSACNKMIHFMETGYKNYKAAAKDCNKIIEETMEARIILDHGISNDLYRKSLRKEYEIFNIDVDKNIKLYSFDDYYEASMDYMNFWRDYFIIHEQYYKNFFEPDSCIYPEADFFNQTCGQYIFIMHKKAIELNLIILKNLGLEIPSFEIYSARKIISPIDFLEHKKDLRASK